MNLARHRLSLLALGILAPVLAFGAIAVSGAPPVAAEERDPFVMPDPPEEIYCLNTVIYSYVGLDGRGYDLVVVVCSDGSTYYQTFPTWTSPEYPEGQRARTSRCPESDDDGVCYISWDCNDGTFGGSCP